MSSPSAPPIAPTIAPPIAPPPTQPRAVFTAAASTAIVAALALSWDRPGIGWLLTTLVVIAAVLVAVCSGREGAESSRVWSGRAMVRAGCAVAVQMLLLAVGAVRAAGWLFGLCVLTAGFVGCVILTNHGSIGGMLLAPLRVAGSVPAALRWLGRAAIPARGQQHTFVRTLIAALIAVALLVVFGLLLAGADVAFAHMLSTMVPSWDSGTLLRWTVSAAFAVTITAVTAHLLLTGTSTPEDRSHPRLVRRIEWALPVGGVIVLFAGFVAVQATVLFGGREYVMATAGLNYAEYARSGFWQLLAVTGLTVIVVGVTARIAPRATAIDRLLLRTLLGLLSAFTLVIVASALSRMAAYEQAFGFTRQRLLVTACELWLGVIFLLILVAGVRLRGRWVPRAAVATAVSTLLALVILNPDAFIARQNIARFLGTGHIDIDYLTTLSADAVPELQTLPEPYRSCALTAFHRKLTADRPETWLEWNLGRHTARTQLHQLLPASFSCPP